MFEDLLEDKSKEFDPDQKRNFYANALSVVMTHMLKEMQVLRLT